MKLWYIVASCWIFLYELFYSVATEDQYIVNNTLLWLPGSVWSNHPRASICCMKVRTHWMLYEGTHTLNVVWRYAHAECCMKVRTRWMLYEGTHTLNVVWRYAHTECCMKVCTHWMLYEGTHTLNVVWRYAHTECCMKVRTHWMLYEGTHTLNVVWRYAYTECFMKVRTHWMLYEGTHTLNVPSYNKYWSEDGVIKPKHVAKTMYYWLYIWMLYCDWIQ